MLGAIIGKCVNSTTSIYLFSFEAELDGVVTGVVTGMKASTRLMNILNELIIVDFVAFNCLSTIERRITFFHLILWKFEIQNLQVFRFKLHKVCDSKFSGWLGTT